MHTCLCVCTLRLIFRADGPHTWSELDELVSERDALWVLLRGYSLTSAHYSPCEQFPLFPGVFMRVNKMGQFWEQPSCLSVCVKLHKIIQYILKKGVCGLEGNCFMHMDLGLHTCATKDITGIKKIRQGEGYWKKTRECFCLPVACCVGALLPEVGNVAWHEKLSEAKLQVTSCVLLQLSLTPPQLCETASILLLCRDIW